VKKIHYNGIFMKLVALHTYTNFPTINFHTYLVSAILVAPSLLVPLGWKNTGNVSTKNFPPKLFLKHLKSFKPNWCLLFRDLRFRYLEDYNEHMPYISQILYTGRKQFKACPFIICFVF
jgi:hypothetical protein